MSRDSNLQKIIFLTGVGLAISLTGTIAALVVKRLLPGHPLATLIGPFICAGSALAFSKYYYGRF
ncbi:hypothetical protein [Mesorhizobium sp. 131-3-5]|uniref:hypothetical protein n=1 Tax=Mesorhizobium sp. 131-3-5 TaxID=2744520 RepID=UPI001926284B|nr:hypothetical protein [Mesorhizobium sp. 131-3-5]